jgi:hypothetical protein
LQIEHEACIVCALYIFFCIKTLEHFHYTFMHNRCSVGGTLSTKYMFFFLLSSMVSLELEAKIDGIGRLILFLVLCCKW